MNEIVCIICSFIIYVLILLFLQMDLFQHPLGYIYKTQYKRKSTNLIAILSLFNHSDRSDKTFLVWNRWIWDFLVPSEPRVTRTQHNIFTTQK